MAGMSVSPRSTDGAGPATLSPVAAEDAARGRRRSSRSLQRRGSSPNISKGMRINIFINGDSHSTARTMVADPHARSVEHLLHLLEKKIKHPSVARRLYTPENGHRITDIGDLEDGGTYVVGGKEPFKKLNYINIVSTYAKERAHRQRQNAAPVTRRKSMAQRAHIQGRISNALFATKPKVIYLIRNGDERNKTVQLLLTARNCHNLDQLHEHASLKLDLETPCRSIYTVTGLPVESLSELDMHGTYVAVGRIPFKQVGYKPVGPPQRAPRKVSLPKIVPPKLSIDDADAAGALRSRRPSVLSMQTPRLRRLSRSNSTDDDTDNILVTPGRTPSETPRSGRRPTAEYALEIRTGDHPDAGTESDLLIMFCGKDGSISGPARVRNEIDMESGSTKRLNVHVADVGEVTGITVKLNAELGHDPWFVESILVTRIGLISRRTNRKISAGAGRSSPNPDTDSESKLTSRDPNAKLKYCFFGSDYMGTWLGQTNGTAESTALAVYSDTPEKAQLEINTAKKIELIGYDPREVYGVIEEYPAIVRRIEDLCRDGKALKRLWRKADREMLGFTTCHALWAVLRKRYPPIHIRPMLELAHAQVYGSKVVTDDLRVSKQGFKPYLLTLVYACRVYEAVEFPDVVAEHKLSQDGLGNLMAKLDLSLTADEADNQFYQLRHGDGCAHLPEVIRWYCERVCPADLSVTISRKKRSRRSRDSSDNRKTLSPENSPDRQRQRRASLSSGTEAELDSKDSAVALVSVNGGDIDIHPTTGDAKVENQTNDDVPIVLNGDVTENYPSGADQSDGGKDEDDFLVENQTIRRLNERRNTIVLEDNGYIEEATFRRESSGAMDDIARSSEKAPSPTVTDIRNRQLSVLPAIGVFGNRDTQSRISLSPTAVDSDDVEGSLMDYERRLKEIEESPQVLVSLWRRCCNDIEGNNSLHNACFAVKVRELISDKFPAVGTRRSAFNRAFFQLCTGPDTIVVLDDANNDPPENAQVRSEDFFSLIIHTVYFWAFFDIVDDMEQDPGRRVDLTQFRKLLADLGMAGLVMVAAGEFDAMDSNVDGLVLSDEICTWYAHNQFHRGTTIDVGTLL